MPRISIKSKEEQNKRKIYCQHVRGASYFQWFVDLSRHCYKQSCIVLWPSSSHDFSSKMSTNVLIGAELVYSNNLTQCFWFPKKHSNDYKKRKILIVCCTFGENVHESKMITILL